MKQLLIRYFKILSILSLLLTQGCALMNPPQDMTVDPNKGKALVSSTANHKMYTEVFRNENIRAAYIYQIDGKRVTYKQDGFYLTPGKHTIMAWPVLDQPANMIMVPDIAYIGLHNIRVEPITIEVKADHRYFIGMETIQFRTVGTLGEVSYPSDWQPVFVPKLVKVLPPLDPVEAAKGLGAFFGSLLVIPLLLAL